MHVSLLVIGILLTGTALAGNGRYSEQVTVQTTECDGATGFSSFDERRIYRVQPGPCPNPDAPGELLQQILLYSVSGISRYDVLLVTAAEAHSAMEQIRANRIARQNRYRSNRQVVVVNQPPQLAANTMPAAGGNPATPRPGVDAAPPTLQIIEPPVADADEQFWARTRVPERVIVGRVLAPAGLVSLSINGRPVPVSGRGIFKGTVRTQGDETPVEIVAVDMLGQRSMRLLSLLMSDNAENATQQGPVDE